MTKRILIALTLMMAAAAYASIPSTTTVGTDATENFCSSGGVCVVVCKNQKGNVDVGFSDFVDLDTGSQKVSRKILDRFGSTSSEQLRQATLRLTEANPEFATEFDAAMDDLQNPQWVSGVNLSHLAEGCAYKRVAFYSHSQKAFVIEKELYNRLSATDQAGLRARLTLERVSDKNSKANRDLVQRLFYGNAEDLQNTRHGAQPTTRSERLEVLRHLIDEVDTQNTVKFD